VAEASFASVRKPTNRPKPITCGIVDGSTLWVGLSKVQTQAQAKKRLLKGCAKVRRSALTWFDPFLKTLTKWLAEIVNYFAERRSSGFVEGLNNKIKTLKRRCYGIGRVATLFQRLYLDLEGYRRFA